MLKSEYSILKKKTHGAYRRNKSNVSNIINRNHIFIKKTFIMSKKIKIYYKIKYIPNQSNKNCFKIKG